MANIRKVYCNGSKVSQPVYQGRQVLALYYNGQCVWKNGENFTLITIWNIPQGTFVFPKIENISHLGTIDWGDGTSERYDSAVEITHNYSQSKAFTISIECNIETILSSAFQRKTDLLSFLCTTATIYEPNCFASCTNLQSIIVSDKMVDIPFRFAVGCSNLMSFNFHVGMNSIGGLAFSGCTKLGKDIYLDCKSIGTMAFSECKSITNISISDNIEIITYNEDDTGSGAIYSGQFLNTDNLETLEIGKENCNLKHIPSLLNNGIIDNIQLKTVKIAEGIETMGGSTNANQPVFHIGAVDVPDCTVYLPSTINYLGHWCFFTHDETDGSEHNHILTIIYNGTLEDWNKIKKHDYVFNIHSIGLDTERILKTIDGKRYTLNVDGSIKDEIEE